MGGICLESGHIIAYDSGQEMLFFVQPQQKRLEARQAEKVLFREAVFPVPPVGCWHLSSH